MKKSNLTAPFRLSVEHPIRLSASAATPRGNRESGRKLLIQPPLQPAARARKVDFNSAAAHIERRARERSPSIPCQS